MIHSLVYNFTLSLFFIKKCISQIHRLYKGLCSVATPEETYQFCIFFFFFLLFSFFFFGTLTSATQLINKKRKKEIDSESCIITYIELRQTVPGSWWCSGSCCYRRFRYRLLLLHHSRWRYGSPFGTDLAGAVRSRPLPEPVPAPAPSSSSSSWAPGSSPTKTRPGLARRRRRHQHSRHRRRLRRHRWPVPRRTVRARVPSSSRWTTAATRRNSTANGRTETRNRHTHISGGWWWPNGASALGADCLGEGEEGRVEEKGTDVKNNDKKGGQEGT